MLSSQEIEILRLLAKGESAGAIAKKLSLTARTVGHRRAKIMAKLHAKGVTDLAKYATEKE